MGARGVLGVLRQICRALLEKDTKGSLEYMAWFWPDAERSLRLAVVVDPVKAICGGEVGETVVSYIFVRYFCASYKRVDTIYSLLMSLRAYKNATLYGSSPLSHLVFCIMSPTAVRQ